MNDESIRNGSNDLSSLSISDYISKSGMLFSKSAVFCTKSCQKGLQTDFHFH